MDNCINNIETLLDAITFHEEEENANYVVSDQDKILLTDTLDRLKILNAQDKSRSVTLHEEDGNKCGHNDIEFSFDKDYSICRNCGQKIYR